MSQKAPQTWRNILECDSLTSLYDVEESTSEAIQSQYSHAPRLTAIVRAMQEGLDPSADLDRLHEWFWDIDTASGIALDFWGQIVGADREIQVSGQSVFLDDEYFRFLIKYKAAANISNGSADSINRLLSMLLDKPVFVVDYHDMTIGVYVFGKLTDMERSILTSYGLLTRDAGVEWNITEIENLEGVFGFIGGGYQPFRYTEDGEVGGGVFFNRKSEQ